METKCFQDKRSSKFARTAELKIANEQIIKTIYEIEESEIIILN